MTREKTWTLMSIRELLRKQMFDPIYLKFCHKWARELELAEEDLHVLNSLSSRRLPDSRSCGMRIEELP